MSAADRPRPLYLWRVTLPFWPRNMARGGYTPTFVGLAHSMEEAAQLARKRADDCGVDGCGPEECPFHARNEEEREVVSVERLQGVSFAPGPLCTAMVPRYRFVEPPPNPSSTT